MGKPNVYGAVKLENNELYQEIDGVKTSAGKVDLSSTVKLDANKNLVTAENVTIENGFNNVVTGKNSTIKKASGVTLNATDTDVFEGANYSGCSGDAHDISGYSSRTDGYQNQNHIDGGIAQGTNLKLGSVNAPNKFSQSGAVGSTFGIQGSGIYAVGKGAGQELTKPGTYLLCGAHTLALLP